MSHATNEVLPRYGIRAPVAGITRKVFRVLYCSGIIKSGKRMFLQHGEIPLARTIRESEA
jgi:hypothetical protein